MNFLAYINVNERNNDEVSVKTSATNFQSIHYEIYRGVNHPVTTVSRGRYKNPAVRVNLRGRPTQLRRIYGRFTVEKSFLTAVSLQ